MTPAREGMRHDLQLQKVNLRVRRDIRAREVEARGRRAVDAGREGYSSQHTARAHERKGSR